MKELNQFFDLKSIDCTKSTLLSYKNAIDRFILYFEVKNISDLSAIKSEDMQQYMYILANNKNSKNSETAKNSANSHFRVVKSFYNWLIEK